VLSLPLMPKTPILFCACFLLGLLAGCTSPRLEREAKDTPLGSEYQPANVYKVPGESLTVTRVAVLPFIAVDLGFPFMPEVEAALIHELRATGRFEVLIVPQRWVFETTGIPDLSYSGQLPVELLAKIEREFRTTTVLQTEVTSFRPYKPIRLGLRSRLYSASENRVLWACDEVFSAGNRKVMLGARRYAENEIDQPYPLQSSYSALLSPRRFAGYVGQTLFNTLPPVEGHPIAMKAADSHDHY